MSLGHHTTKLKRRGQTPNLQLFVAKSSPPPRLTKETYIPSHLDFTYLHSRTLHDDPTPPYSIVNALYPTSQSVYPPVPTSLFTPGLKTFWNIRLCRRQGFPSFTIDPGPSPWQALVGGTTITNRCRISSPSVEGECLLRKPKDWHKSDTIKMYRLCKWRDHRLRPYCHLGRWPLPSEREEKSAPDNTCTMVQWSSDISTNAGDKVQGVPLYSLRPLSPRRVDVHRSPVRRETNPSLFIPFLSSPVPHGRTLENGSSFTRGSDTRLL